MKKIKLKKILIKFFTFIVSFVLCFSCFGIVSFADENNTIDIGGYYAVLEAVYLNNYNNTYIPADVTTNENGDIRVNLSGNYNNNTRMCALKITFPNGAPNGAVRFTTAIYSAGSTYVDSEWAKPKLNTEPTNNNSFYTGSYYDNSGYIDYQGVLPDTFYIISWFEYPYDVGYLRTLYISPSIYLLSSYDGDRFNVNQNNLQFNTVESNENIETVVSGFNDLDIGTHYPNLSNSLKALSISFNRFLSVGVPNQFIELLYVLLGIGCISMILGIVSFVIRRK